MPTSGPWPQRWARSARRPCRRPVETAGSRARRRRALTAALIEARAMAAGYNGVPVVHDVDLRVEPGEVVALLGPNGVGKTTILLTLSGELPAIRGEIVWQGRATTAALHKRARQGLALVTEDRSVFMGLSTA